MEYIAGVDAFTFTQANTPPFDRRTRPKIPKADVRFRHSIAAKVLSALGYLHARRIVHNDVKLENVIIGARRIEEVTEETRVVLIDFEMAFSLDRPEVALSSAGSWPWRAPEKQLDTIPLSAAMDMYSFGMLLYTLFSGRFPFDDVKYKGVDYDSMCRLIERVRLNLKEDTHPILYRPGLQEAMLWCLQVDPEERQTSEFMLSHGVFA
jgi:serine/threonine protein kinase